jgi:hypothetical protein
VAGPFQNNLVTSTNTLFKLTDTEKQKSIDFDLTTLIPSIDSQEEFSVKSQPKSKNVTISYSDTRPCSLRQPFKRPVKKVANQGDLGVAIPSESFDFASNQREEALKGIKKVNQISRHENAALSSFLTQCSDRMRHISQATQVLCIG